jgi:hypothetical protein
MLFYHYTSVSLADTILSSGLKHGHMNSLEGLIRDVVWLTTDPSPDGHGLLNGREKLTASQVAYMQKVQGGPLRNARTTDKTKIRLTVNLPDDELHILQSYVEYCRTREGGEKFAKVMGLSCYFDVGSIEPKRLKALMKSQRTKEKTWWISFAPIPARYIAAVDYRHSDSFRPYSFDQVGRAELEEVGLYAPSSQSLEALQSIVPPSHLFEQTKALVICTAPANNPVVLIRGAGTERFFDINECQRIAGPAAADDEPRIIEWLRQHRAELLACWERAIDSYYTYYPERRA